MSCVHEPSRTLAHIIWFVPIAKWTRDGPKGGGGGQGGSPLHSQPKEKREKKFRPP